MKTQRLKRLIYNYYGRTEFADKIIKIREFRNKLKKEQEK